MNQWLMELNATGRLGGDPLLALKPTKCFKLVRSRVRSIGSIVQVWEKLVNWVSMRYLFTCRIC